MARVAASTDPVVAFSDLEELREAAVGRWPVGVRAFVEEGAGDGRAVAANRDAQRKWALRSRVLVDVSSIQTAVDVLGVRTPSPVLVAPSGLHTLVHPDGEVATAEGARDAEAIMILSSGTGRSLQDVRKVGGHTWFQLYFGADRDRVRHIVELASDAGCQAICLTADMPVRPLLGPRMRAGVASVADARPMYVMPRGAHLGTGAWDHDARLTWADLEWLRRISNLPLVVKGIMHPEDAIRAADCGVEAIVVSNHGGRALDTPLGTMDVLPEVLDAVADRQLEVYVDGGFRHGGEIAVALALGARAVLIGRPVLWALTIDGAHGVTSLLRILRGQLASTMGMLGATAVAELRPSQVRRIAP